MSEKQIYIEKYKKPFPGLANKFLPKLNHIHETFTCFEAKILAAGVVERDGHKFEFQDIRVYLKEENEK